MLFYESMKVNSSAIFLLLTTVLVTPMSASSGDLQLLPFRAGYSVKHAGIKIAESRFTLSKNDDGRYLFESISKSKGLAFLLKTKIVESSTLTVTDKTIKPLSYSYHLGRWGKHRSYKTGFDWDNNRVNIDQDGQLSSLDVPDNTLDRFSLQLIIMHELAKGKDRFEYVVLHKAKLSTFEFVKSGTEKITTRAGTFETVVVKGQKIDSNSIRTMTFWCAPSLHYLPVKIIQLKNNKPLHAMSLKYVEGL
ncbi:MAG: hypothetical protein BMS9Abin33_1032 [Gammaproteobacteria bacterium]|nr:MAG: hypothetical protein BMS9Abin33_1032 [Gammaproteobacteria bacterium]